MMQTQNSMFPSNMNLPAVGSPTSWAAGAAKTAGRMCRAIAAKFDSAVFEPIRVWNRLEQDMSALAWMDGRELQDMGVTRGDFYAIRSGSYRRAAANDEIERIVFCPETRTEPKRPQGVPTIVPFCPDPGWYDRYWLQDNSPRR